MSAQGDVAQRREQDYDVRREVDPLHIAVQQLPHGHCKRIVPAGGAAREHAYSDSAADEYRADHRREQRHFGDARPEPREALKYRVERGEGQACHARTDDEAPAEDAQAKHIAGRVHYK